MCIGQPQLGFDHSSLIMWLTDICSSVKSGNVTTIVQLTELFLLLCVLKNGLSTVHNSQVSVECRPRTACTTTYDGRWMHSWYLVNVTAHSSISDTQTKTTGRWVRFLESGGMHWRPKRRNSITILPTRFEALQSVVYVILTTRTLCFNENVSFDNSFGKRTAYYVLICR